MSIYITGDIHASFDIAKLTESNFDTTGLSKSDYVIICGDFGLVWHNSPSEQYWLRWLDARPFTTLFIDGNHEGFHTLNALPVESWNGGKVHKVGESIYHLMRGQLFTIEGTTLFTMGGAASSAYDKETRTEGEGWFPEEIPSEAERENAVQTLEDASWGCDYVITHCAPTSCEPGIAAATDRLALHPMDEYTDWLESIRAKLYFKHWFCGHYHIDADISGNVTATYNRIAKLQEPSANDENSETQTGNDDELDASHENSSTIYEIVKPPSSPIAPDPFENLADEIE